mmetsp:Transcript_15019/g.34815  ORF Transcript_15019/g.34815 Transcript_15019/m.34815 type:complete len:367 (+) Transcript_15019:169-1269(+)|eukprot:CAMPEP_0197177394 /NCGR_PEP_ID=MMETSP1423-20130617/3015_1 /TAXON_ID=476441 /ORGANISM="Pseudo-nitzschia heimii, Strain UNC1101" /LENGTH=366 /DNA_ID=CAMNT_0042626931 /DNA_START=122 /DNA_END=1222 /DNA_ORIENTATION=-
MFSKLQLLSLVLVSLRISVCLSFGVETAGLFEVRSTSSAAAASPSPSSSLRRKHQRTAFPRRRADDATIISRSSSTVVVSRSSSASSTRCFNFLKNAFENAFSNDRSLSTDKRKGQYDDIYTGEEYINNDAADVDTDDGLTEVQRKWRQAQQQQQSQAARAGSGGATSGAAVSPETVVGTSLNLDLYLSGVPERDPSNDLYGSRVNISSRDKGTGLSLPSEPSVEGIRIDFLGDGVCRVSDSGFTSRENDAMWKLSDDGSTLRVGIDALGYTRTVQTKGSIQKVYWTDEDEKSIRTSTTYQIPPGMVYGDFRVAPGRIRGSVELSEKEGALRIEKSTGLFGISNQMVACGKFVAKVLREEPTDPGA